MRNPIFDIENWKEIGATLARNKTRTFLTAFGIFWGTAMLSMLMGGAGGLRGMLMRNFNGFATNMGAVFASRTTLSYKGFNKGMSWNLNDNDMNMIRRTVPWIEYFSPIHQSMGTIAYGSKSKSVYCNGVETDYFKIQNPLLYEGRLLNDNDFFNNRKVVLLGKNVADELFGTASPIGKFVSINGVYFQAVGVVGQKSNVTIGSRLDSGVVLPLPTMRRAFNLGNDVGFVAMTVESGHTPTEIKPAIFRAVRQNHPIHPDDENALGMMDVTQEFRMVDNLFIGISLLAIFVGAGTLIAGIIGVGNIMWIIVKERTQEIGIRRAIGAKPRDIIIQILSEGMVLTAIAGTAGVVFATLVLAAVDHFTFDPLLGSAHFQLSFSNAMGIMAVFLILGTFAGLIPAIRAMKIKPIEAINDK